MVWGHNVDRREHHEVKLRLEYKSGIEKDKRERGRRGERTRADKRREEQPKTWLELLNLVCMKIEKCGEA